MKRRDRLVQKYRTAMDWSRTYLAAPVVVIYYYSDEGTDCPECTYDPINKESTNPDCPTCFPVNTLILTSNGWKNIQDIDTYDFVLIGNDTYKVMKTFARDYNENMVKITTSKNSIGVEATADHEFYVIEGHNYVRSVDDTTRFHYDLLQRSNVITKKKAKDIQLSDFLLYPVNTSDNYCTDIDFSFNNRNHWSREDIDFLKKHYKNSEWNVLISRLNRSWSSILHKANRIGLCKMHSRMKYKQVGEKNVVHDFSKYISIDEDLAKFLGWYIAEGCVPNKRYPRTTILSLRYPEEYSIAQELLLLGKKIFNLDGKIKIRAKHHVLDISFHSSAVASFMKSKCGIGADTKCIPQELYYSDYIKTLLQTMVAGDGYVRERRGTQETSYITISRILAYQVFDLAVRLGYSPYIMSQGPYSKNGVNHSKVFTVGWTDSSKKRGSFYVTVNGQKYYAMKVKQIEKYKPCQPVYNIEIEHVHKYVANGYLVKNCGGTGRIRTERAKTIDANVSWRGITEKYEWTNLPGGKIETGDVVVSCKLADVLINTSNTAGATYFDISNYVKVNNRKCKVETTPLRYGLAGDLYNCAVVLVLDED